MNNIDSLVLSGGGIRGIAFCGCIKFLHEQNILQNIKNIAGTSAGSIIALLISIGYNYDELEEIILNLDFNQFKDNTFFSEMYNLYNNYGLHSGNKLLEYIKNLIKNKTGNGDYTFEQLYKDKKINLVITSSCLNQEKEYYFSYENYPDLSIAKACRMSMAIPFIFESVKFNGDIFVDGGLLNNYPIWIFGRDNPNVLGLKLSQIDLISIDRPIKSFYDYSLQILNSMFLEMEKTKIDDCYWDKTIIINTLGISSSDFNINIKQKQELIKSGYECISKKLIYK